MAGVNLHEHIETKKTKYSKKKRSSGPCLSQDNELTGLASYTVLDEWMEKAEMEIETKKMEWKMKMEDKWKTRNEGTNDNNHPYPPETVLYYWDKPNENGYEIMYRNERDDNA